MAAFGEHLEARPLAGADDLYKFLHQAVFGPAHAVPDRAAAAGFLERELTTLGAPLASEPSCEMLGGGPALVRVNLRPFVAAGGDPQSLIDAFVNAANRPRGGPELMSQVLDLGVRWLRCAGRGELSSELAEFAVEMAAEGYPAVHHSELYREAYLPAYRVVDGAEAAAHGWCGVTFEQEPADSR